MTTIEDKLKELAQSGPLPVAQALDLAHRIGDLVEQAAASLKGKGHFQEAAELYEEAAHAFRLAAEKVPRTDRKRLASLGDFWSVKANRTQRTAPPVTPVEQPTAPTTGSLVPKVQPAGESKPPAVGLKRPWGVPDGRRLVSQPPPFTGGPRPLAVGPKKPGEILMGGRRLVGQPPPLTSGPKRFAVGPKKPGEILVGGRRLVGQPPPLIGGPKRLAVDLKKPWEVPGGRRPAGESPPLIDESKPSTMARLRQALGLKKPDKA